MAVKLVYLFKKIGDPLEFLNHHNNEFLALLRDLPKAGTIKVSQVKADSYGGDPVYFLITEVTFRNKNLLEKALLSYENEKLSKDIDKFARGATTIMITEELDLDKETLNKKTRF
ncbi:MAG TPA: EthD family reductase [Trueperaceae bacterium]|nr:EthD family reductase [Trueperaceae bacterium]